MDGRNRRTGEVVRSLYELSIPTPQLTAGAARAAQSCVQLGFEVLQALWAACFNG